MLVECKNCGAPLSVKDDAGRYVECGYCGKTNRLRTLRTLQAQTPAQWAPPPVWVKAGSSTPLQYSETRVKAVSVGLVLAIVGIVLPSVAGVIAGVIGLIVAIGAVSWGVAESVESGGLAALTWDGATPFACAGHDRVTISGVSANLPGAVAISVGDHCHLTLEGSSITARVALSVSGHGQVIVRGGRLEGSPNAIEAAGHASVEAIGAEIVGEVTQERHAHVFR